MVTLDVAEVDDRPLVVIVEDDPKARELRREGLEDAGLAVMDANDVDAAFDLIRHTPSVDMVITDIHLGSAYGGRGGIYLAQTLRNSYDPELPMAAYSGHYYDRDFSPREREELQELFVARLPKGARSGRQQRAFYAECREFATQHRRSRRNRELPTVASNHQGIRVHSLEGESIEQVLRQLGYKLSLLGSDAFEELAAPVAIWSRTSSQGVEVHVVGQPRLYWFSETEDGAVQGLLQVMAGVSSDLDEWTGDVAPELSRLRQYLASVMRRRV